MTIVRSLSVHNEAQWLSWLERRPVTAEVESSSLFWVVRIARYDVIFSYGIIAQLGEHLPYKQRVIGSSPIGPTLQHVMCCENAAVAELADAQDLKSCGTYTPVPVRFRSAAFNKSLIFKGTEKLPFFVGVFLYLLY